VTAAVAESTLAWSLSLEEDRRFYRILGVCLLASSLAGVIVPAIPLPVAEILATDDLPPRRVRLLDPAPAPEIPVSPVIDAVGRVDPIPPPQPVDAGSAERPSISDTGVLAMGEALARLQQRRPGAGTPVRPVASAANAPAPEPSILGEGLTEVGGSVGVSVSHESLLGSTDLPGRAVGTGSRAPGAGGSSEGAIQSTGIVRTRSEEEIQEVLDRHKGAMYALYNQALRRNPELQGKLLLRITILPSGVVERSEILESSLGDGSLERGLAALVREIEFGDRADVGAVTTRVPIEFFPQ
jgi:protein TonB